MAKNNERMGGASPHNELIAKAICRGSGYAATEKAMASSTCSNYKGSDKHRHWESAGSGTAGNVHGYGKK